MKTSSEPLLPKALNDLRATAGVSGETSVGGGGTMHFSTGNLYFSSWQETKWSPSYLRLHMYPHNLPVPQDCLNRPMELNDNTSPAFLSVANGSYVQPPGVPFFGPNRLLP